LELNALVAPVCLSGANVRISEETLPRFAGKRIRIFAHNDEAGKAAAERWTEQLKDIATVDRFTFKGLEMADGKAVKDLNEPLKIKRARSRMDGKSLSVPEIFVVETEFMPL
jgi:hypothetical protein